MYATHLFFFILIPFRVVINSRIFAAATSFCFVNYMQSGALSQIISEVRSFDLARHVFPHGKFLRLLFGKRMKCFVGINVGDPSTFKFFLNEDKSLV